MTEALVGKLGYLGIALLLVLGGLGLPVPEEAPIILAAILSKSEKLWWPLALGSCLFGVLLGDFIVYFIGYIYGEKVINLRFTQKFLTRARETQIKGYFHRHGYKILILGRFAVGFRTAAYLTAGILKLPVVKLFLTDLCAATFSTCLMFGLGYFFAHQIQTSLDSAKYWLTAAVALAVGSWLIHRFYKARQRAGKAVGPRVLDPADLDLPPERPVVPSRIEARAETSLSVSTSTGDGLEPQPPVPIAPPVEPILGVHAGAAKRDLDPSEIGKTLETITPADAPR